MLRRGSLVSRVAAVAILGLVLLAVHQFLVMPVMARLAANEQQILHKSDLLQRYQTLEATRPALTDRLADIRSRDHAGKGYWQGVSAVRTAAKLQDRVSQSVEAYGGNMVSVQTLASGGTEEDDMLETRETRLRTRFTATHDGLAEILHAMESTTPYMFIDQLSVMSKRSRSNRAGDNAADQAPKLEVWLDVFGYVRERPLPSDKITEEGEITEADEITGAGEITGPDG